MAHYTHCLNGPGGAIKRWEMRGKGGEKKKGKQRMKLTGKHPMKKQVLKMPRRQREDLKITSEKVALVVVKESNLSGG